MNIVDSTTVNYAGKLISNNPSIGMVILVVVVALVYAIVNLSKNTELTKILVGRHDSIDKVAKTVEEIRADQITSNSERKEQGKKIDDIDNRLTSLEGKVEQMSCRNAETCINRKV